jgi:hypothetical protein
MAEVKPVTAKVDYAAIDRLEQQAREHLATLTPERRKQLREEWK